MNLEKQFRKNYAQGMFIFLGIIFYNIEFYFKLGTGLLLKFYPSYIFGCLVQSILFIILRRDSSNEIHMYLFRISCNYLKHFMPNL